MTPEEFLAQHDAVEGLDAALAPMCAMIARVRQLFIEETGVSPDAADLLTVEWCRAVMFPMITPPVAA